MTAQAKKQRVLLCEDEYIIVMQIRKALQRAGYEVIGETGEGARAVELAKQLQPDLILMDINLRDHITGIEATRAILAERFVPILILSAHSDQEHIESALESGAWGYVLKPIDGKQLLSIVEAAITYFDRFQTGMEAVTEIKQEKPRSQLPDPKPDIKL